MRFVFHIFLSILLISKVCGQIPPGNWRMHLPYNKAIGLAEMDNSIFVGTNSGIFRYGRLDGSLEILNKVNGLSDVGISAFAKHPSQELMLVGYVNGNLDLIKQGQIFNLRDIINSAVLGSRRINSIHFSGNLAFLACDFGIVVYNIGKREVKESNLAMGSGGNTIVVSDCLKFADTLYAVTSEGLKTLPANKPIKNTASWVKIGPESGVPPNPLDIQSVDSVGDKLVLGTWFGLQVKSGARFELRAPYGGEIRSVRQFGDKVLFCVSDNVVELDNAAINTTRILDNEYYKKISRPSDAIYDAEGTCWVSDLDNGLLRIRNNDTTRILPNGPYFSESFSLSTFLDKVVLHAGGYTYPTGNQSSNNTSGFAVFSGNDWKTYNQQFTPLMPKVKDVCHSFFNPADQQLYLSTFGYGILNLKADDQFGILNDSTTNGGLCNIFIPDCIFNANDPSEANLGRTYIRITSSSVDAAGNLWATCFNNNQASISFRSYSDQTWNKVILPSANDQFPMEIISDQSNFKWVRMAPGMLSDNAAIWVLDALGNKKVKLTSSPGSGGLPSNEIYDIKEDKNGYIWVGTTKGLAVFYNPYNVFFDGGISASTPIFPPEAGRPVLENDVVTCIEIDGANRKWVGTKDNGVWLFNEDITQVIKQFNTSNSPLVSNFIYDIVVNKTTGEVFFATDNGLVSFQGDATENLDAQGKTRVDVCDESRLKVFPNPVPKAFDGTIAIQGLATNAEVKFVTPSGKLVYKTIAKGSMATWDGFTYDGIKAPPGIYLILTSTPDGKATCTSKIAILD